MGLGYSADGFGSAEAIDQFLVAQIGELLAGVLAHVGVLPRPSAGKTGRMTIVGKPQEDQRLGIA